MLEVHDLQVAYGQARALWGVSFDLRGNELLCVVGPNGAGKTTLINTLAGVLRARAGRIVFEGRDITALPPHRFCEAGIAIVPEGRRLFASMSVRENLEIGSLLPAPRRGARRRSRRCWRCSRRWRPSSDRLPANCRAASSRWWRSAAR